MERSNPDGPDAMQHLEKIVDELGLAHVVRFLPTSPITNQISCQRATRRKPLGLHMTPSCSGELRSCCSGEVSAMWAFPDVPGGP